MATTWGSIVGSYGRIGVNVTTSNTSDTQTKVTVKVYFWSKYSVSDSSNTLYFDFGSTSATTSKGSFSISTSVSSGDGWSTSNQKLLATYTKTYTRTTSAQTISCAAKLTGIDRVGGTMTVDASFTIPKKTSYTVSYNANGGSGAPGSQTKWYGTTLTLSSTKPTRTGYTFQGWGLSSTTSTVTYKAGGSYTANASDTLYAVWKINTYTVSYNANGGSGAPSSQTKTYGITLTLSNTKPTRTGYTFQKWNTNSSGTGTNYSSGGSYTANSAATLYAVWKINTYTVSYNANGGSGAPSAQTKTYGTALTLSSTKPTRTGYTFKGWATSSSGSVKYAAGASYTSNAAVTLYAVWEIITYTVSYNANGGSGAPSSQTKTYGKTLTLSTTIPTRTNYDFLGWATSSSGSVKYAAGGSYTSNAAVTLYAVWKLSYWTPKITSSSVSRCDSDGTANEEGTYCKLTFKWECCQIGGTNPIKSITYAIGSGSAIDITPEDTTLTSGSITVVIGGSLSLENSYSIEIIVADNEGGSTTNTITLPATKFLLDFKSGGTGVSIGEPASYNGFSVNMNSKFKKRILSTSDDGKQFGIEHGTENVNAGYFTKRTDTGTSAWFGIGSGGINHGVYSQMINDSGGWMIFADDAGYVKSNRSQKLLWSGGYYMTADHTVTLSDTIDKQLNGIVLVFSRYADSESKNDNFSSFFVAKGVVATHPGCGHSFFMMKHDFAVCGGKYLYIYNDKIVGHADNNTTGTGASGITYNNKYYVLRYVIGV